MSRFVLTEELRKSIEQSTLDEEEKKKLLDKSWISFHNLKSFYIQCKPTSSLFDLLLITKIMLDVEVEKPERPKTKDFLNLMQALRIKEKEDQYRKLITHPSKYETLYQSDEKDDLSPAKASKDLKDQVTTIVNIIISVVSVVYALWYWTGTSMQASLGHRVLICLFFGILVLVAEVVVYMGYLSRVEEARNKERKKKEVKKIVRTIKLS